MINVHSLHNQKQVDCGLKTINTYDACAYVQCALHVIQSTRTRFSFKANLMHTIISLAPLF